MLRRFKLFKKRHDPLDDEISAVLDEMDKIGVNSERYSNMMAYLERLHGLKMKQRREPLSRDTIALIVGNLMGVLLIVAYEQKHVITSKGFNQIIRPK